MEDYSNYRETPRTGRAPGYSSHEHSPQVVDPSVLTDDRDNPNLLAFEKTWGHRVLAGIGVAMLVIALVLAVFCIIQLVRVAEIAAVMPDVGIVLALMFLAYAAVVTPYYIVTALLYTLLLIVLPVIYLIAALKIKRSL